MSNNIECGVCGNVVVSDDAGCPYCAAMEMDAGKQDGPYNTGVVVHGGCVEPGGLALEGHINDEPCPSCSQPATHNTYESADGGSINLYTSVSCSHCGYHSCDDPANDHHYDPAQERENERYNEAMDFFVSNTSLYVENTLRVAFNADPSFQGRAFPFYSAAPLKITVTSMLEWINRFAVSDAQEEQIAELAIKAMRSPDDKRLFRECFHYFHNTYRPYLCCYF